MMISGKLPKNNRKTHSPTGTSRIPITMQTITLMMLTKEN